MSGVSEPLARSRFSDVVRHGGVDAVRVLLPRTTAIRALLKRTAAIRVVNILDVPEKFFCLLGRNRIASDIRQVRY